MNLFFLFCELYFLYLKTTPRNGYLGSRIDEERSELRDVMRIAYVRESLNL